MSPDEYDRALACLDLTRGEAATLVGQTKSAAQRYASGDRSVPGPVEVVLRLLLAGHVTVEQVRAVMAEPLRLK